MRRKNISNGRFPKSLLPRAQWWRGGGEVVEGASAMDDTAATAPPNNNPLLSEASARLGLPNVLPDPQQMSTEVDGNAIAG